MCVRVWVRAQAKGPSAGWGRLGRRAAARRASIPARMSLPRFRTAGARGGRIVLRCSVQFAGQAVQRGSAYGLRDRVTLSLLQYLSFPANVPPPPTVAIPGQLEPGNTAVRPPALSPSLDEREGRGSRDGGGGKDSRGGCVPGGRSLMDGVDGFARLASITSGIHGGRPPPNGASRWASVSSGQPPHFTHLRPALVQPPSARSHHWSDHPGPVPLRASSVSLPGTRWD